MLKTRTKGAIKKNNSKISKLVLGDAPDLC
jgi:hypothetical protein